MKSYICFILGLLSSLSAQAQAQSLNPSTIISYSAEGVLSNFACYTDRATTKNSSGLILHSDLRANPTERYYTLIDGRAVTSCAAFDFTASNPTQLILTYRAVSAAISSCSDGCRGTSCGTGGEPEIFISPDPSRRAAGTWKFIGNVTSNRFARQTQMTSITANLNSSSGTVRSVLVCRNGGGQDRDDIEVDSLTLTAPTGGTLAAAPSPASPARENLTTFWTAAQTKINNEPGQVWDLYYPITSIYPLLSGWIVDQNPTWRASIERQVLWAHNNRLLNSIPLPKGSAVYTRDHIARETLALYHVYETFNNPQYLTWVDDTANKMIDLLKRDYIKVSNGRTYKLFYGQYSKTAPYNPVLPETEHISPNQNAEIGLLFTLLYNNPQSRLYRSTTALDIATQELDASISIQRTNGALPLSDGNPYDDTNYATYTFALLAMANVYWHDADYDRALTLGGQWLQQFMTPAQYGQHMGNNIFSDVEYHSEMWQRTLVYTKVRANLNDYIPRLTTQWLDPLKDYIYGDAIVFMKAAGVSLETFVRPPMITTSSKSVPFGGTTYVTWSAPGMQSCRIYSKMDGYFGETLWDTRLNGTNVAAGGIKAVATWRLSCTAVDGTTYETSTSVNEPAISASTLTVPYGGTTYITWSAPEMQSCRIYSKMDGYFGETLWDTRLSGTNVAAGGIKSAASWRISCTSKNGIVYEKTTQVNVEPTLSTSATSVVSGGTTYITWNAAGMQSCKIYSTMAPNFVNVLWDTRLSGTNVAAGGIISASSWRLSCVSTNGLRFEKIATVTIKP